MKKFEADRLEEAYDIACKEFGCSITELEYEIIQYPTKGVLGLFAKKAIIIADIKKDIQKDTTKAETIENKTEKDETIKNDTETEVKQTETDTKEISDEVVSDNNDTENQDEILKSFFTESSETTKDKKVVESNKETESKKTQIDSSEVAKEIETHLKKLIESLCFDIDTVEVDVEDNTAYIFIDGEDAALLIGKEGYRYNALSYLLFNWINQNYNLYIKLEIARFLQSQEEMIKNYIQPVVEHVEQEGWGRTKPLDGILAQIALEQLRKRFPNKYVAMKKNRIDNKRYIIVNDFINYN